VKKIEIIERITDANGSISENILTSWEHKNQFIPEIIRFGELKIYLQERIVKKNDSDVHLSKYEYDILLLLAKSPGRMHIAKLNGRICGAKRSHSVFEQPNCYQSSLCNLILIMIVAISGMVNTSF
jgi:hypothetical protein